MTNNHGIFITSEEVRDMVILLETWEVKKHSIVIGKTNEALSLK